MHQTGHHSDITIHSEIVDVALQPTPQRGVLHLHRLMPMAPAPSVDGFDGPSEARTARLARPPPTTAPCPLPIKRDPQEGEGGRTVPVLLFRRGLPKV